MPDDAAEEIRRLASGPVDWDLLLRSAGYNALIPLLAHQLPVLGPRMPAGAREQLQTQTRANAGRALLLTAELFKLLSLFEAASIVAIPYKGLVIAAQAYGDLALRQFEDIDIVIRHRDAPKAHEIMSGLGYRLRPEGAPSPAATSTIPGEYSYQDDVRQLIVELHTERTLRHFPVAPDLDAIAQRLVSVRIGQREVKTFAPEEGLTFLAVHGSKDLWARLSWVADIAELVRAHPGLDWRAAHRFAGSLHAERMLNLGLALAASLLDAPLPGQVALRVERDHVARGLASAFAEKLSGGGPQAQSAPARFRLRRQLVAGPVRGWRYAMRLALAPAQDDFAAASLPLALAPLYAVLRPFRLLRKYGQD